MPRGGPPKALLWFSLAAAAATAAFVLLRRVRHRRRLAHLRALKLASAAKTKTEARRRLVPFLPPEEECAALLGLSYTELKARLLSGDLNATAALAVFQTKALDIDLELNCVNEAFPAALEAARRLDSCSAGDRGRLHGVPISVKEGLPMAGCDSTAGNTTGALVPRDRTMLLIRVLEAAGALPFVHTNMAQGGRGIDCQNALFGETAHPLDRERSPGGSSGGEAALIAAGGSPLGLGSDLGGSIRIPASLCGIFGFKPTAARLSRRDMPMSPLSRLRIVDVSLGPLARDLEAIFDLMRVLFSAALFEADHRTAPLPFDEAALAGTNQQRLVIGYYTELRDPCLQPPTPAVQRAMQLAVAALEARGHCLIEWQPPRPQEVTAITMQAFATDGGRGFVRSTARELLTPDLAARRRFLRLGHYSRTLVGHLLGRLHSPMDARHLLGSRGFRSVEALWQWCAHADAYRLEFQEAWEAAGIDCLLCPVQPFGAALPRGATHRLRLGGLYASIYNFLDYPAGAVPVTKVTPEDLAGLADYPSHDPVLRRMASAQRGTEGLPVGLQMVAPPWRDELCLRAMRELRDALL